LRYSSKNDKCQNRRKEPNDRVGRPREIDEVNGPLIIEPVWNPQLIDQHDPTKEHGYGERYGQRNGKQNLKPGVSIWDGRSQAVSVSHGNSQANDIHKAETIRACESSGVTPEQAFCR
jgi:hypothetical protein